MEVIQANYLRSNALFSKILNLLDIDFTNVNDPRWRRGILKVIVSFFIYFSKYIKKLTITFINIFIQFS